MIVAEPAGQTVIVDAVLLMMVTAPDAPQLPAPVVAHTEPGGVADTSKIFEIVGSFTPLLVHEPAAQLPTTFRLATKLGALSTTFATMPS